MFIFPLDNFNYLKYNSIVKLTLQIKLLVNDNQSSSLLKTIQEANHACNIISDITWKNQVFNQFKIHRLCYHTIKESFNLSAQIIIRCISKVTDAYKLDRKTKRVFREGGGITYDSRILSYNIPKLTVSIWSMDGRLKIPFVCHNKKYLPFIKGEADLVYKKGKFYLFQTVNIPDEEIKDVEEFIGVDFGLVSIATTSEGKEYTSKKLNDYREKRQRIRGSLQRKGTKGAKKLLKRLSGKEERTGSIVNHTISKAIVALTKKTKKGIAIEDLTNIRFTASDRGRKIRIRMGRWGFSQLRAFLEYKALLNGIRLVVVEPAYTSQMCNICYKLGKRNGKVFKCEKCNVISDADINAARNISLLGVFINDPEKLNMFGCSLHI